MNVIKNVAKRLSNNRFASKLDYSKYFLGLSYRPYGIEKITSLFKNKEFVAGMFDPHETRFTFWYFGIYEGVNYNGDRIYFICSYSSVTPFHSPEKTIKPLRIYSEVEAVSEDEDDIMKEFAKLVSNYRSWQSAFR